MYSSPMILDDEGAQAQIAQFLSHNAAAFCHELVAFACSPFNVSAYDVLVRYHAPPPPPMRVRGSACDSDDRTGDGSGSHDDDDDDDEAQQRGRKGGRQRRRTRRRSSSGARNAAKSTSLGGRPTPNLAENYIENQSKTLSNDVSTKHAAATKRAVTYTTAATRVQTNGTPSARASNTTLSPLNSEILESRCRTAGSERDGNAREAAPAAAAAAAASAAVSPEFAAEFAKYDAEFETKLLEAHVRKKYANQPQ